MANLKNITELPVAEYTEGLNLIVNDNGAAKQIAASAVGAQADFAITDENSPSFIKNKPHRELMYEWNFEATENPDDCVFEIMENVDNDISWLTTITDENISFEIEVSQYGMYEYNNDGDLAVAVNPDISITGIVNDILVYTQDNILMRAPYTFIGRPTDFLNNGEIQYFESYVNIGAFNKMHLDNDYNVTEVTEGGCIDIWTEDAPFKSIKIYKVYR